MASPFGSRVTATVDLPFDPPHTITIRKLAGRHLGKAHAAFVAELFADVQQRGGAAVQKDMQQLFTGDAAKDAEKAVEEVKADPLNGFDKYFIVQSGLTGWSYDVPVSAEAIDDLDDDAVTFVATAIMRLTKPSLFQNADEQEAARKNA